MQKEEGFLNYFSLTEKVPQLSYLLEGYDLYAYQNVIANMIFFSITYNF